MLIPAIKELKSGDPKREDVFVGPLISEKEAKRVESWVEEAVQKGESHCSITGTTPLHKSIPNPLQPPGIFVSALMSLC
jgi:acyl-CoA reductase-like NAD-dependent aldehyde dehydrogenase